jgi:hypothetical protein
LEALEYLLECWCWWHGRRRLERLEKPLERGARNPEVLCYGALGIPLRQELTDARQIDVLGHSGSPSGGVRACVSAWSVLETYGVTVDPQPDAP